jgi:asparagine synthetase B (glutamine-hydrolysing)
MKSCPCEIQVQIATPDHRKYSGSWGALVILSQKFPEVSGELEPEGFERLMATHKHEWSAILVGSKNGVSEVTLWKSITSSYDIYYSLRRNRLFLGDLFTSCAIQLPQSERAAHADAIIDHFLFTTVFGTNTYLDSVKRVGHGMKVTISPSQNETTSVSFQRISRQWEARGEKAYLEDIEQSLADALAEAPFENHALLFSGGVDSTLLATYLNASPLLAHQISSPEFAPEMKYARDAANLLDRSLAMHCIPEDEFLYRLEALVDRVGMPPHGAQTVLFDSTFESQPYDCFITGDIADTLFGFFVHDHGHYGPTLAHPLIRPVLKLLGATGVNRLENMRNIAESFSLSPGELGSFAFRAARRMSESTAARLFTKEEIHQRFEARRDYVASVADCDWSKPSRENHLEAHHHINFVCEESFRIWRQVATSHKKSIYTPFNSPRVFDAAMSIPPASRYMDKKTTKHLLKKLLSRKMPSYPIDQRKLGGVLPIARFMSQGPLSEFWQHYQLPEFMDKKTFETISKQDPKALWQLLTFSVWKKRIVTLNTSPTPLVTLEFSNGCAAIRAGG